MDGLRRLGFILTVDPCVVFDTGIVLGCKGH